MPLNVPIPIADLEQATELPSTSYYLDLDRGRIMRRGSVDGMEAVQQYIRKALVTPRFQCPIIYDNQYGSELKQTIIAGDATPEFIQSEIPRLVRDALLVDSRILDVFDFTVRQEFDKVYVSFTATTIFGTMSVEVLV